MKICMLMFRLMPQTYRRVVVSNSVYKRYMDVDIFCIKQEGQSDFENHNGVQYYRLPIFYKTGDSQPQVLIKYFKFTIMSFIELVKIRPKKKYDIIHIHNPPDFFILGAIPFKLIYGTKIILDLHDMLPEAFVSNLNVPENHIFVKIAKFIENISIWFSDAVICTNEYDKSIVLSRNNLSPDKIFVVMNSPDMEILKIETGSKSALKLDKKFVILFEGSIWKRRGIQTVIDAVEILKEKLPIYFLIVGDGPDIEDLKKYVDEKELQAFIWFTGWVNLKELSEYISVADICLIPFLETKVNARGVPNKLFEYIVHDKPVFSSNLKGIASTYNNEEITFFEPGNATDLAEKIFWGYNNQEKLKAMTAAAKRRYYAEYTWERMEKELYRCYDSLIDEVKK
jgi:glycosyltransferase involved in cell wall biosynthesis